MPDEVVGDIGKAYTVTSAVVYIGGQAQAFNAEVFLDHDSAPTVEDES